MKAKKENLFARVTRSQRDNVKYAQKEVTTKRKLFANPFIVNMTRWTLNEIESAIVRGLNVNEGSVEAYAGYSSVTLYATIKDLPSLKDPTFISFLSRVDNIWNGATVAERDYASPESGTAYRDYTISWVGRGDLGDGWEREIKFQFSLTAYIAGEADRKCHVEEVEGERQVTVTKKYRIVCDD